MRVAVTGGAGFLGSHLCERLIHEGHQVTCLDSLLTGDKKNLESLTAEERFSYRQLDVTEEYDVEGSLDWVFHFASPASPVDFEKLPIEILKVGAYGTLNGLSVAREKGAGFFLASTSEVYGDPELHPQPETYSGNVNLTGPRAVYDEGKRFAEAATYSYRRTHSISIRVARYFNTYGPLMRRDDGRAVPDFIDRALSGRPLVVHGNGLQTRSLCYVDDTVEGTFRLWESNVEDPVNIGSSDEITVLELAEKIRDLIGRRSEIKFADPRPDDPARRRPNTARAQRLLGWAPEVSLEEGLKRTIEWCGENWV